MVSARKRGPSACAIAVALELEAERQGVSSVEFFDLAEQGRGFMRLAFARGHRHRGCVGGVGAGKAGAVSGRALAAGRLLSVSGETEAEVGTWATARRAGDVFWGLGGLDVRLGYARVGLFLSAAGFFIRRPACLLLGRPTRGFRLRPRPLLFFGPCPLLFLRLRPGLLLGPRASLLLLSPRPSLLLTPRPSLLLLSLRPSGFLGRPARLFLSRPAPLLRS